MLNIANLNKESIIKKAIENTKSDLDGLDYERMCLVYNWYLYENLKDMSCLAYIVDTNDLGFDYKHRFVLVPVDDSNYYLNKVTGTNKDITIDESLFREAKGLGK